MPKTATRPAGRPDISTRDHALLETPQGRENDFGASNENRLNNDELERPEVATRPRSEITGKHDEGSGANETIDGLDEHQEAARHGAEDIPANENRKTLSDIPVFDRRDTEPKV